MLVAALGWRGQLQGGGESGGPRGTLASPARSRSTGSGPPPSRTPSAVIAGFNKKYPNVNVSYTSVGNNMPTVLATAIAGGNPPDMADIAQPGLVKQLASRAI